MPEFLQQIAQYLQASDSLGSLLVSTLIFMAVMFTARAGVYRFIRRIELPAEARRKWLIQSRNGLLLLSVLGLVMIWGEELRTLALSIVAIAVAFVVATKELILCVTGSLIRTASQSFKIGDRIHVKDYRGDVVDHNLLATTLMEVGPGKLTHQRTGRVTVVPNALFVSEPVINESYSHDFVLHAFVVPFKRDEDWQTAQTLLLDSAKQHCEPYLENARRFMKRQSDRSGVDIPSVDPRVSLQVPVAGEIHLVVRLPVPYEQRNYIEQRILADVFTRLQVPEKLDA